MSSSHLPVFSTTFLHIPHHGAAKTDLKSCFLEDLGVFPYCGYLTLTLTLILLKCHLQKAFAHLAEEALQPIHWWRAMVQDITGHGRRAKTFSWVSILRDSSLAQRLPGCGGRTEPSLPVLEAAEAYEE